MGGSEGTITKAEGGLEEEEEGLSARSSGGGVLKPKGGKKTEGDGNHHSPLAKLGFARTPESGISSKQPQLIRNRLMKAWLLDQRVNQTSPSCIIET
jgi:hypothetical protein